MPGQQKSRRARPAVDEGEADGFVIDTKPKPVDLAEPAQRRKRSAALALSRERELERLVFGGEAELANPFADDARGGDTSDDDEPDGGGLELADEEDAAVRPRDSSAAARPAPRAGVAAWHDDDDGDDDGRPLTVSLTQAARTRKLRRNATESTIDVNEYEARLRERFNQTHGNVAWAKRRPGRGGAAADGASRRRRGNGDDGSSDEGGEEAAEADADADDDDDPLAAVLRSTKPLLTKSGLSASELHVERAADANVAERSSAVVQAIDFHPTNELFLTAGLDKTLRLFRLDGADNPKVQGVRFDDLPLTLAAFTRDGRQVLAAGRGRHAYALDLATSAVLRLPAQLGDAAGKAHDGLALSPDGEWLALSVASSGTVLLLAARSKQLVATLRMNRRGSALAFVGPGLLASGSKAGEVYLWDVRSQRCACRLQDEGLSDTSALAADHAGTRLAVGSASGIVNVYDARALLAAEGRAPPLRALSNLTTAATALAFSHDARLLALASKHKRNALRVAHVPSLRVYANWPTGKTPVRHAQCVAFHPRGRYFASGDDRGHVLLYKLPGYTE